MTNEEIIELAREAGFKQRHNSPVEWWMLTEHIHTFANAIIKAHEAELLKGVGDPVAIAYDFDGYGWRYIDNGSGSIWREIGENWKDHQRLYTESQVAGLLAKAKQEYDEPQKG